MADNKESQLDEMRRENQNLKQLVKDTCDDMECLPGCNSLAHDEQCPVVHPMEAWRALRRREQQLEEEVERFKQTLEDSDNYKSFCEMERDLEVAHQANSEISEHNQELSKENERLSQQLQTDTKLK